MSNPVTEWLQRSLQGDEEAFASHKGYVDGPVLRRFLQELRRIDISRQFNPGKESAFRVAALRADREIGIDAAQHGVAPFPVNLTDFMMMIRIIALFKELCT